MRYENCDSRDVYLEKENKKKRVAMSIASAVIMSLFAILFIILAMFVILASWK